MEDITTNPYFVDWYIKTHMRATSYLFGILAGFLVHYIRDNEYDGTTDRADCWCKR